MGKRKVEKYNFKVNRLIWFDAFILRKINGIVSRCLVYKVFRLLYFIYFYIGFWYYFWDRNF